MTENAEAVARVRDEEIAEWAVHSGDDILAAAGRTRGADGNGSQDDLDWL